MVTEKIQSSKLTHIAIIVTIIAIAAALTAIATSLLVYYVNHWGQYGLTVTSEEIGTYPWRILGTFETSLYWSPGNGQIQILAAPVIPIAIAIVIISALEERWSKKDA